MDDPDRLADLERRLAAIDARLAGMERRLDALEAVMAEVVRLMRLDQPVP